MQADNWKKIKEILQEVLKIEPERRLDFLEKSGLSGEIRAEVESLLAFEEASEDLMNLSAVEFSRDFFDEDENDLIGAHIGTVSGQATAGASSTSSTLIALRYCESGFHCEWTWFLAATAAICRAVVP